MSARSAMLTPVRLEIHQHIITHEPLRRPVVSSSTPGSS
jgi:hypothetical protein